MFCFVFLWDLGVLSFSFCCLVGRKLWDKRMWCLGCRTHSPFQSLMVVEFCGLSFFLCLDVGNVWEKKI